MSARRRDCRCNVNVIVINNLVYHVACARACVRVCVRVFWRMCARACLFASVCEYDKRRPSKVFKENTILLHKSLSVARYSFIRGNVVSTKVHTPRSAAGGLEETVLMRLNQNK